MAVEDLLGEGQALLAEDATDLGVLVEELLVGRGKRLGRGKVSPVGRDRNGSNGNTTRWSEAGGAAQDSLEEKSAFKNKNCQWPRTKYRDGTARAAGNVN